MKNLKTLSIAPLIFVAIGMSASCEKEIKPKPDAPILGIPDTPITDYEGNIYNTVKIGDQVWMAENLKATKYRNGDPIPNITNNTEWVALITPAYCSYNNNYDTYGDVYGLLYNWYTVDVASNGNNNIAPEGWHVPTNDECATLIAYLGGINVAGGKMKERGTEHWLQPNTGATNESGFTALPAGFRDYINGTFDYVGSFGHWWTCTEDNEYLAWNMATFFLDAPANKSTSNKKLGFSIRCVKD